MQYIYININRLILIYFYELYLQYNFSKKTNENKSDNAENYNINNQEEPAIVVSKFDKNIWGINRPKINKELFCNKIKNNDNAHKLTSEQILNKLFDINNNIRGKPRNSRVKPNININIHKSAEEIDLFLGLDRIMSWIDEI